MFPDVSWFKGTIKGFNVLAQSKCWYRFVIDVAIIVNIVNIVATLSEAEGDERFSESPNALL